MDAPIAGASGPEARAQLFRSPLRLRAGRTATILFHCSPECLAYAISGIRGPMGKHTRDRGLDLDIETGPQEQVDIDMG
jgi:hypothetical protein